VEVSRDGEKERLTNNIQSYLPELTDANVFARILRVF